MRQLVHIFRQDPCAFLNSIGIGTSEMDITLNGQIFIRLKGDVKGVMVVDSNTGEWSLNSEKGDLIDLYGRVHGLGGLANRREILRHLASDLGLEL